MQLFDDGNNRICWLVQQIPLSNADANANANANTDANANADPNYDDASTLDPPPPPPPPPLVHIPSASADAGNDEDGHEDGDELLQALQSAKLAHYYNARNTHSHERTYKRFCIVLKCRRSAVLSIAFQHELGIGNALGLCETEIELGSSEC